MMHSNKGKTAELFFSSVRSGVTNTPHSGERTKRMSYRLQCNRSSKRWILVWRAILGRLQTIRRAAAPASRRSRSGPCFSNDRLNQSFDGAAVYSVRAILGSLCFLMAAPTRGVPLREAKISILRRGRRVNVHDKCGNPTAIHFFDQGDHPSTSDPTKNVARIGR
jgi:hypothetical protein